MAFATAVAKAGAGASLELRKARSTSDGFTLEGVR